MKHRPIDKIKEYRKLLERYAKTLDLLSSAGLRHLDEHFETSLRYADVIKRMTPSPTAVLDIGSGSGLPGVILAIELSPTRVYLVERRRRRSAFLEIVVSRLELTNAAVFWSDSNHLDTTDLGGVRAEVVTAQAVGTFAQIYRETAHLHAGSVTLISRKGPEWQREIAVLRSEIDVEAEITANESLVNRGTLVAVRLMGGKRCRS